MLLLIPGIFPVAKPLFRIWPLRFVFYLNVTFISVELRIRWLSEWTSWLEMIIKGLMSFPFRIFGWVRFNFPVLTSDLVARVTCSILHVNGPAQLRIGNNFWNCTDLNRKLLKTNNQSTGLPWQSKINFKVYSEFFQTLLQLNLINNFISICSLMKQSSRVGIPLVIKKSYDLAQLEHNWL